MTKKRKRKEKAALESKIEKKTIRANETNVDKKSNWRSRLLWLVIGALVAAFFSVGVPKESLNKYRFMR